MEAATSFLNRKTSAYNFLACRLHLTRWTVCLTPVFTFCSLSTSEYFKWYDPEKQISFVPTVDDEKQRYLRVITWSHDPASLHTKNCLSWHHSHCTKFGNMRSPPPPPKHDLKITGGYITMQHEISGVQLNTGYWCCLCRARGFFSLVMTTDTVFFCLGIAPRVQLLKNSG